MESFLEQLPMTYYLPVKNITTVWFYGDITIKREVITHPKQPEVFCEYTGKAMNTAVYCWADRLKELQKDRGVKDLIYDESTLQIQYNYGEYLGNIQKVILQFGIEKALIKFEEFIDITEI